MRNKLLQAESSIGRERGRRRPGFGMTANGQSASFLLDQLLQSHTELSSALRLAGRQILRYAPNDDGALERIRKVLKRADHLRLAISGPAELQDIADKMVPVLGRGELPDGQLSSEFGPELSIVESR